MTGPPQGPADPSAGPEPELAAAGEPDGTLPAAAATVPTNRQADLASLDERLGLLLVVRVALVLAVVAAGLFAASETNVHLDSIGPLVASYLVLAGGVEWLRRSSSRVHLALHRLMVPLDSVFLLVVTVPSGGPRSVLVGLFAVHLIALTLLASPRTGLRVAVWDSALFVAIPVFSLSQNVGRIMGDRVVVDPSTAQIILAIAGFWAVAACTAGCSIVSERELRRSRSQLADLAQMSAQLETALQVTDVAETLLRATVRSLGFGRAVFLRIGSGDVHALCFTPEGRRGRRPTGLAPEGANGRLEPLMVFLPDRPDQVVARAVAERQPVLVRRLDPATNPLCQQLLPDARNVVVLAIEEHGPVVMLLERGGRSTGERMSRRDLVVLSQFTAHAALALRNVALLTERARLAAIDGLTGLANRREFDRTLGRDVSRAVRAGEPLSVAIVDIDHFKAINDTQGHLAGDEILRRLSRALEHGSRDMDVVARFGGEEFALILPRCELADAAHVLERIMARLTSTSGLEGVTISGGIACIRPDVSTPAALVAAADEAMYASKRAGRNRLSLAGRPAPAEAGVSGGETTGPRGAGRSEVR